MMGKKSSLVFDVVASAKGVTSDGKEFETSNFNVINLISKITGIVDEKYPELNDDIDRLFSVLYVEDQKVREDFEKKMEEYKNAAGVVEGIEETAPEPEPSDVVDAPQPEPKDLFREMYPQFYDESGVMKESAAKFLDQLIKEYYLGDIESYSEEKEHKMAM